MPKIQIDDREDESLKELAKLANYEVTRLPVGDFVCLDGASICIEHKQANDFLRSVDRIFEQAANMIENNFDRKFLVITGDVFALIEEDNIEIDPHVVLGMLSSLSVRYGINIIMIPADFNHLLYLVNKIVEKSTDGKSYDDKMFRIVKSPKDRKVAALCQAERLGREKAQALLEKFGSVTAVLQATEEQLKEVDGIGPKIAKNIKELGANDKEETKTDEGTEDGAINTL